MGLMSLHAQVSIDGDNHRLLSSRKGEFSNARFIQFSFTNFNHPIILFLRRFGEW